MKKDLLIVFFLILAGIVGAVFFRVFTHYTPPTFNEVPGPGQNGGLITKPQEGKVTLKIGETASVGNVVLEPLSLVEDSRCAEGVRCIWAGTVKVRLSVTSGLGSSENTIELGKSMTTEAEEITFIDASPAKKQNTAIKEGEYRFTFEVKLRDPQVINPGTSTGNCYIGGCSGEVCSDQEGIASNCIYKEEFACYKSAVCERQSNGACGWTQTSALTTCLQNAR